MTADDALTVQDLNVSFRHTAVLHDVSLRVPRGSIVGLVGESGSGKSTLGKTVVGINTATSGRILLDGTDLTTLTVRARRALSRDVQYIPQNPYSSLSPRRTIGQTLAEALDPWKPQPGRHREAIARALADVQLPADAADKYPHEFSGGQRQRIAIARALVVEPRLVIADEITSALDVSVQAEILELLRATHQRTSWSMVFISHNLAVVRNLCDRVAVMAAGEIVEEGPVAEVYHRPRHHYTARLLASVPGSPGFSLATA